MGTESEIYRKQTDRVRKGVEQWRERAGQRESERAIGGARRENERVRQGKAAVATALPNRQKMHTAPKTTSLWQTSLKRTHAV